MGYESALVEVPEFPPLGVGGLGCFNQNPGRPELPVVVLNFDYRQFICQQVRLPPALHQQTGPRVCIHHERVVSYVVWRCSQEAHLSRRGWCVGSPVKYRVVMAVPRFTLLVFDSMEENWVGAFEPLQSLSGREILERLSLLNLEVSNFFLLRMIPVMCDVPNVMNWTRVTVMVVFNVPLLERQISVDMGLLGFDLGLHATWIRGSAVPVVPLSVRFMWSTVCGATLDPAAAAPMSLLLQEYVSHLPPARLREIWRRVVTRSTPCSPVARDGRSERAALARARSNPYSASYAPR